MSRDGYDGSQNTTDASVICSDKGTFPSLQNISNHSNPPASPERDTVSRFSSVPSLCSQISPCSHGAEMVRDWTVDDVCQFVDSMEVCKPYVEVSLNNKTYNK